MVALAKSVVRTVPVTEPVFRPEARPRRVAVVLNRNARKADAETLGWIRSVVPHEDLFVSTSIEDLRPICEMILARRYDAVMWGGGDGTFVRGVATLQEMADARGVRMPDAGVMRMGTGNAVAETVGAAECTPDGFSLDLSRARAHARRRELTMLEVEGQPSVFAGFGLDSQILDDFGKTVTALRKVGLAEAIKSANARYFLAVAGRSLPRFLMSPRTEVVAINRGGPAQKIDVDGRPIGQPIANGRVLWRGPATLASAATVPFYGLGLKMFPHAMQRPDAFQLRVTDVSAIEILAKLPEVWRGRYQGQHVHDFICDKVELVMAKPMPFQSGGDLVGERSSVVIGVHERRVSVI